MGNSRGKHNKHCEAVPGRVPQRLPLEASCLPYQSERYVDTQLQGSDILLVKLQENDVESALLWGADARVLLRQLQQRVLSRVLPLCGDNPVQLPRSGLLRLTWIQQDWSVLL